MSGRGRGRGSIGRWDPSFDGRAIASVPPLKKHNSSTVNKMNERMKLSSVRVTCIIDVNHFWAQLGSNSDLQHFDNYMFALNHWCDNQIPSTISDMPNVGQVVCVHHSASRMWRRAEVTRLSQRMVDVFFLDYGEAECVSLDMLCSNVPSDITSWPPQALYCTLDGIQPPEGEDQWSERAVKRFTELVLFEQNLVASHENGSLQLTLYLVDESHMKSVGSILVEEDLAQETPYEPRGDLWPEVPQRSQQHKKENPQVKNLPVDKLEQQLVLSGFSYLINPCNEQKPEFTYETTTISSSYCTTYKGSKEPTVVSSSSTIQNFSPTKDRSPQSHLSSRPHLASPGEFMTSSHKMPFGKEPVPGIVQEENHPRQDPVRNIPVSEDSSPWYNAWPQQDWKLPQDKTTLPYGSNDMYSSDKNQQSLADLSFQDTKQGSTSLQYHLDGPSAFHDPKYKQQQPLMGPFSVTSQEVYRTQPSPQQQQVKNSLVKSQLPENNVQEKTLKTELSWQKWKFQRNIKRLFDKSQSEESNMQDIGLEIGTMINDSRLSQHFEGISEVMMVLEMITERVLDNNEFSPFAAKICSLLSGLEIPRFTSYMCEVVTAIRDDFTEHLTISDWQKRCERFCSFIGEMVVIAASQDCTDSSFKSAIDIIVSQSLEKWITLDEVDDEKKLNGFAVCLTGLLEVIGPVMEEQNLRFGSFDLESIFSTVRDLVLSEDIPRSVKSALLDLMMLKAAGWPKKTQSTDKENSNSENAFLETNECDQDWDPYGKVYAMLEKLKLEDLFKKFKDNRIRDTLLVANKEEFKKTLQEAGFPPGVILEIQMFLEKGEELPYRKKSTNSSKGVRNKTDCLHSQGEQVEQNAEKLEIPVQLVHHDQPRAPPPRRSPEYQPVKPVFSEQDNELDRKSTELDELVREQTRQDEERKPTSVAEQRRQETEENKASIIDSHNLFEPSYLSRPPPLRLDTGSFEYDPEQDSPNQDGPMSYSAVLKAKNEESFPEPPSRAMAVKLTSLTKANANENVNIPNKQPPGKVNSKETSKETTNKRDQGPRPPPGLPPLPPQNWGQSPELRLTVLPNARRGKSDDATMSPSESEVWQGRQSFGSPPRSSVGRGGVSQRGRHDASRGFSRGNNEWQGKAEPLSWRRLDNEFSKSAREGEQMVRPFGPGGQKACFTCGSREHMSCNDRSKLFFD